MRPRRSPLSPESESAVEIDVVAPERAAAFRRQHEREALSTEWNFPVVWHERTYDLAAFADERIVGALALRVAASLGRLESLAVVPELRRRGVGRRLLERAETLANYYNCHKITLEAPVASEALAFFEACGYKLEAVLPQHTWKRDVAVMRKFLL